MNRLTEWTGYEWIAKQERVDGKYITDRNIYNKLAEYEDTGLEPEDILSNIKTLSSELNNGFEELKKYQRLEEHGLLIKLPCKVKSFVNILNRLNYPDEIFIYDNGESVWQGYINEKQIYKCLEDEEIIEVYLGENGLVVRVA